MVSDIRKYPRTRHVRGSRFQHGDHDLEAVSFSELAGKHLVVEEKIDGANCGVSFDENGNLLLQSRGHYLRGGPRERQFDLLKRWANENADMLFDLLEGRYVMYAEWMYAKHTFFYDALPSYFMEFDILDTETGDFLSTERRRQMICGLPITQVRVLHEGPVKDLKALSAMIQRSYFVSDQRQQNFVQACSAAKVNVGLALTQTDTSDLMEGLYIKHEEDGKVIGRYKFVRESFTNTILDSETHWHDRPIVPNRLRDGVDFFSVGQQK